VARKLRFVFPGARYHVLNRGNYRLAIFASAGAVGSFLTTLDEACRRHRWRIHAYVVMRNHFHVALETPEPNLPQGMHWLLGTFATRFNRFRSERGHLFQGRFQAQLVEDASALGRVVDYIHLNPVRAGLVPPGEADRFEGSSLPVLRRGDGPEWLTGEFILARMGSAGSAAGWERYAAHLSQVAASPELQAHLGFKSLSRDWAIGTRGWRQALAKAHAHRALNPGLEAGEVRALREARWGRALAEAGANMGLSLQELAAGTRPLSVKIELAARLRSQMAVPYAWIAQHLKISNAASLRMQVHRALLQVSP
jgi:putative transposase